MRDVVIVGAGHNALVAACYLAREGLDVEVVERREVVGGAVSTVERFPGYAVDVGSSAHIMFRFTGIAEDLNLSSCGLTYLDLEPWGFAPFGAPDEQKAITFSRSLDATCASIEAVCGAGDADAYRTWAKDWGRRNERIFAAFAEPPSMRSLGKAGWLLGRDTRLAGGEIARQFLQPGDALLDATFADERLKTALSWLGAQSGPPMHEVATADLVGWNAMLHKHSPGHPVGGSGMLSVALARRFASYGGKLRLGDGAARITTSGDRATGVVTESGEHIQAKTVLAGCHLLATLELLGNEALLRRATTRVRVGNGIGMVVRLGTTDLPRYPTATSSTYRAMQLLARSREQLRAAHGDFGAGRPPREPAVLAMTFSAFDEAIAPPGRHNITLWGQWHPYALADGTSWDDIGRREADKFVAEVERAAPGFAGSIEHVHVQTPLDLERELGLRRGNVMHLEMGLDQMFALRPLPELSGYRTPVDGLYLTGASTHPGGGVFGASGRSAARVMLTDRRRRSRRLLTRVRSPR
jgi:phytoene dehydrogenase-like protein